MIARSLKRKSKSRLTVVLISTRYRSVDDASDLIAPTVQRFPTEKADWPGNRVVGVSVESEFGAFAPLDVTTGMVVGSAL